MRVSKVASIRDVLNCCVVMRQTHNLDRHDLILYLYIKYKESQWLCLCATTHSRVRKTNQWGQIHCCPR